MSATSQTLPAYALLIAVNGHNLVAPESDAARLQRTLVNLGVRQSSIELLTGASATRNNIIQSLRNLCTNPRIARDAPILIYFAGHGMQQRIRIPNVGERKAEFIFPSDALTRRAHPIPDITISALVGNIARSKGNHITLLFDCCHSGGGSRDATTPGTTGDSPQLPEDLLNFDTEVFEKEDGELWSEFLNAASPATTGSNSRAASSDRCSPRYQGVTSHVLIASCRENERSFEFAARPGEPPRGLFTAALIEALEECRQDRMVWSLTYSGLFTRVKDIMQDLGQGRYPQTPHCEGYHRDRYVFATPAFPHRQHAITVEEYQQGRQPGLYVLPIGSLAGVPQKATFEVYDYPGGRRRLVGQFPVSGQDDSKSIINAGRDLNLGPDAYAVLCTPPVALAVEMAPDFAPTWGDPRFQADLIARLGSHYSLHDFITPVQPGTRSKLRISGSLRNGVRLQTDSGSLINIPNPSIPLVSEALTKAVMFYYHLTRPTSARNSEPFDLQVLELAETSIQDLPPDDRQPVRALVPHPDRRAIVLSPDNETRIVATHHPDTNFGLRIANKSRDYYFIYVFYFDPSDFSILPIYMPPSADTNRATSTPSLPAAGELTIGYGNEGAPPLQFTIDSHLDKDLGFFKVYYSHNPSEMTTMQQDGFDPNQHGTARPGESAYSHSSAPYGSVLYPVAVVNPQRSRR